MKKYTERKIYEIDNLLQEYPRIILNDKRDFNEIRNEYMEHERLKMNEKQKENINEELLKMEDEITLQEYLKDWDEF